MLSKSPNFRHLQAVALIDSAGSVRAAAEGVFLSQSAVTQAVQQLETDLGATLFERLGSGMRATVAGRKLTARIRRGFVHLQLVAREAGTRHQPGEAAHQLFTATQVRAFVAVARTGGYSLAARELGLSQPSVYKAAKDFEALFPEPFFKRSGAGVELTRQARSIARLAGLALAEFRQGMQEVAELAGRTDSEVIVGCLPLARSGLLPDAITAVLDRYADARIRIVDGPYDELLHGLLDGSIDLIIGALRDPLPAGHLQQRALFDDALSIVVRARHPALRHDVLTAEHYAGLDWIVPRKGTPAREHFEKYFRDRSIAVPERVVECSSLIATRALLLQSDRAAILSARQVALELDYGILVDLSGPLPGTRRQIGIAMRDGWHPTALQESLIDELVSRSGMSGIHSVAGVDGIGA